MESLQKRFERYLIANHKETLENLILQRIEEAKNLPYYNSTVHSQGDWSTLSIKKTGSKIGDVCSKDYEIIQCFTNKRRVSIFSGEYYYLTVGCAINEEVDEMIRELLPDYIESDFTNVCKDLNIMPTNFLESDFLAALAERDYIETHLNVMYELSELQGPIGKLFYNEQIHEYYDRWGDED